MFHSAALLALALPTVAVTQNSDPAQIFTAFVVGLLPLMTLIFRWLDKRQAAVWKREDQEHKQKLAEMAEEAKVEAAKAARLVEESKNERAQQMQDLNSKIDENIEKGNHVNEKIASIGIQIAKNTSDKHGKRKQQAAAHAAARADQPPKLP